MKFFNGLVRSYAQLAREAEECYDSYEYEEPFFDDYDEKIDLGTSYLVNRGMIYSIKTLKKLYSESNEKNEGVICFIRNIYGDSFDYPCTDEDMDYYSECYDQGDIESLFDSLSQDDYRVYR